MFLYMSPDLGLLQFTHSRKAAFAIWYFDLTTEFQPGMLNFPSFFLPVGLIAEDAGASSSKQDAAASICIGEQNFRIDTPISRLEWLCFLHF